LTNCAELVKTKYRAMPAEEGIVPNNRLTRRVEPDEETRLFGAMPNDKGPLLDVNCHRK